MSGLCQSIIIPSMDANSTCQHTQWSLTLPTNRSGKSLQHNLDLRLTVERQCRHCQLSVANQARGFWRMSLSPNMPITCRSTVRRKSMPAKAMRLTVQPWRQKYTFDGLVVVRPFLIRWLKLLADMCLRRQIFSTVRFYLQAEPISKMSSNI